GWGGGGGGEGGERQGQVGGGRADLIGMRRGHDRLRDRLGHLVLELVDADLRALRDDVEIAGMGDLTHVEHALDVVFHFLCSPSQNVDGIISTAPRPPPGAKKDQWANRASWSGTTPAVRSAMQASVASAAS